MASTPTLAPMLLRRRVVTVVLVTLVMLAGCTAPRDGTPGESTDDRRVTDAGEATPGAATSEEGEEEHRLAGELAEADERGRAKAAAYAEALADGRVGRTGPLRPIPNPGWTAEQVWNAHANDWEPAIAADPNDPYVYALTTRFGGTRPCATCPLPRIALRISADEGRTWQPDRELCRCPGIGTAQYDPIIEVADDGSVHAVWLEAFEPGATYRRSDDHGQTWSKPVSMPSAWSDKPVLTVSANGQDVYVAYNGPHGGDLIVSTSHDGGAHFTQHRVVDIDRYFFPGGAWSSDDGQRVAIAATDYALHGYRGRIHSDMAVSDDGGKTWHLIRVATGKQQPECTSRGCYDGFYGPTPTLTGDDDGRIVYVYAANTERQGPQRVYATATMDLGESWSDPVALSPAGANAVFPAATSGGPGDVRVWWMDARTGRWNVWYRNSLDGGITWSKAIRLSNATGGASYKSADGFLEAYGDYGEMDVTSDGSTVAVWGEGESYAGPGNTWFVRQR